MAEPAENGPESSSVIRRTPRWVKVLLGLSLALNLAILGLVAGIATRGGGWRDAGRGNYALPYVVSLPRADRRAVFREMRSAERGGALPSREARRALYSEMLSALRADPFDIEAARKVLTDQAMAGHAVERRAHAAWLARISAMSPETRAQYAFRLEELLRRGPPDRHRPDRENRDK